MDTRTQRNMAKLTEDISEVHSIMTKNIQDVLNHGERLDSKLHIVVSFVQLESWNVCCERAVVGIDLWSCQ